MKVFKALSGISDENGTEEPYNECGGWWMEGGHVRELRPPFLITQDEFDLSGLMQDAALTILLGETPVYCDRVVYHNARHDGKNSMTCWDDYGIIEVVFAYADDFYGPHWVSEFGVHGDLILKECEEGFAKEVLAEYEKDLVSNMEYYADVDS